LVDSDAFLDAIAAADVCVNLRHPSAGETSLSALRALAAGVPVVVSDVGWYREIPDEVCVRICHDGTETAALEKALLHWLRNPERRRVAGAAGRSYVSQVHDPERTAAGYIAFVNRILEHVLA
jgi:glycosyltransferase involved in cell wall biosynthesis